MLGKIKCVLVSHLWWSYFQFYSYYFGNSFQCSVAINQITKGRNKEDKESPELQYLAAEALVKDYKEKAPAKLTLVTNTLKSMKLIS